MDLDTALTELGKIPNINSGGCGLVALALYRMLERKPKIFAVYEFPSEVNKWIPYHLFIEYDSSVIDAEGIWHDGWYPHEEDLYVAEESLVVVEIEESLLLKMLNGQTRGSWNSMFEREKYFRKIEEICGVSLLEVV
jgi:hypothetical protein